jgi:hypothetical protein
VVDEVREQCLEFVPGSELEPLGEGWVAFSSLANQTLILNNEAAAVLDVLADAPATSKEIARIIANDTGLPAPEVDHLIGVAASMLRLAGLVRVCAASAAVHSVVAFLSD